MSIHIKAKKDQIAKVVIMPGCPIRAEKMAKKYLTNLELVSNIRNINVYTGWYQDTKITIAPSGMGMPSIGIYSHELFEFFDVDLIIRAGTCGSFNNNLKLNDLLFVKKVYPETQYLDFFHFQNYLEQDQQLFKLCIDLAYAKGYQIKENIVALSQQEFYFYDTKYLKGFKDIYKIDVVEMEAFSLFANAKLFNKKAICLLQISDIIDLENVGKYQATAKLSDQEREENLTKMFQYAFKICQNFPKWKKKQFKC